MAGMLAGRVALVTGGESGIGAASARALGAVGASVAILYHSDAQGAGVTRAAIEASGARAVTVQTDVGVESDVEAAFDAATQGLGLPDILVNSAGLNMSGIAVADMALAQWERLVRTDLTGAFLTSRRFVRGLRAAGRPGRIVNVSSIHGQAVRAGGADYCAAKAGLESLTRTMAVECGPLAINVNAVAPGMILTPMNARAQEDAAYRARLERYIPSGRAGRAEEVADCILYLCSPAADYMTGAVLTLDGGLSLEQALGA